MAKHYTRNTLEDTAWCGTCGRMTQHKVSAGRLAECLEHERAEPFTVKQRAAIARRARERQNPRLFPE
jgi:hypothetical protein